MNEGIKAWANFLAWLTNGEISAEEAEKIYYEMTEEYERGNECTKEYKL